MQAAYANPNPNPDPNPDPNELEQAWRIFDPLLHHLEQVEQRVPERYAFGSRGPRRADTLINSMGFTRYTVTGVPGFAEDDRD